MVDAPFPPAERMYSQQQFGGRQPEQHSKETMPPAQPAQPPQPLQQQSPQQQQQRRPRASKWDVQAPQEQLSNPAQLAAGGRAPYAEPAPPSAAAAPPAYGGQLAPLRHPRGHANSPVAYGSNASSGLPPPPVMQQQPQQMVAAAPAAGAGSGIAGPEQQQIWFYIDPKASNQRGSALALPGSCLFAALSALRAARLPQQNSHNRPNRCACFFPCFYCAAGHCAGPSQHLAVPHMAGQPVPPARPAGVSMCTCMAQLADHIMPVYLLPVHLPARLLANLCDQPAALSPRCPAAATFWPSKTWRCSSRTAPARCRSACCWAEAGAPVAGVSSLQ